MRGLVRFTHALSVYYDFMTNTREDNMYNDYLDDIYNGYHEQLEMLAHSENMSELSKNIDELKSYVGDIKELEGSINTASLTSLQETASALSTVKLLVDTSNRDSRWNKRFAVITFIVGLAVKIF
jgi:hypothetical protein